MKYNYDQNRKHFFYGYPRSGNEWHELRIMLFLNRCLEDKYPNPSRETIEELIGHEGHLGFDDLLSRNRASELNKFPPLGSHVTILLRNACAVLNSCFYYIHNYEGYKSLFPRQDPPPDAIGEYIRSGFGVEKFVKFLNAVALEFDPLQYEVDFVFYEDTFDKDSVKRIPHILGLDQDLNKSDLDFIYRNSFADSIKRRAEGIVAKRDLIESQNLNEFLSELIAKDSDGSPLRSGKEGNYKETLGEEGQKLISDYVTSHSRLKIYNERYGYVITK